MVLSIITSDQTVMENCPKISVSVDSDLLLDIPMKQQALSRPSEDGALTQHGPLGSLQV